jgi:hypothetical protein
MLEAQVNDDLAGHMLETYLPDELVDDIGPVLLMVQRDEGF